MSFDCLGFHQKLVQEIGWKATSNLGFFCEFDYFSADVAIGRKTKTCINWPKTGLYYIMITTMIGSADFDYFCADNVCFCGSVFVRNTCIQPAYWMEAFLSQQ